MDSTTSTQPARELAMPERRGHDGCLAESCATRRAVLIGAGVLGAAALAGCGSSSNKSAAAQPTTTAAVAGELAQLSDVPVGGAISAKDANNKPIIVSQPTAGQVKAFSAICTHMGCTVAPAGKELDCPCHGSKYDSATGAVIGGPAPRALTAVPVKVVNGAVVPA